LKINIKLNVMNFFDLKLIKFLTAGMLNTVFGYSVYAGLLYIEAPYLIALFIATVAGVIFNYLNFGRMVFHSNNNWSIFRKFIVAYGVIYGVNAIFLQALTKKFLLSPYLGQMICIPLSVFLSWVLMNCWVYKKD
jgi:putative flippase GtrA